MATIQIKKFPLFVVLGTTPQERRKKQKITFDLTFQYNAATAIRADDLAQAVDYERLTQAIIKEASRSRFVLLESLANLILAIALKDPRITKAEALVRKPNALKGSPWVSVRLEGEK